jgi:hypothetical protein
VGAAAGTVAKTISAYDKSVSDDLYGVGERYVSKGRLQAMLTAEWAPLQEQLAHRSSRTRTFVFANTVSARNYSGTNLCHGWVGLRFLRDAGSEPNDILLHVNLFDSSNVLQQEALGILGVNLIYAAYFRIEDHRRFLSVLGQELGLDRIQVDFVEAKGPFLEKWNAKELLVALVACGLSEGVVLPRADNYRPMNEVFYKLPVIIEPGKFEKRERIHSEMLAAALEHAQAERLIETRAALGLFCLSAIESEDAAAPLLSPAELKVRADDLLANGFDVLLTVHRDLYKITALIYRFTAEQVRLVMGLSGLIKVLAASYGELHGRVLEGLARLFTENVRVYVYPMARETLQAKLTPKQALGWTISNPDELLEADKIAPPPPMGHLYAYLLASGLIEPLRLAKAKTPSELA